MVRSSIGDKRGLPGDLSEALEDGVVAKDSFLDDEIWWNIEVNQKRFTIVYIYHLEIKHKNKISFIDITFFNKNGDKKSITSVEILLHRPKQLKIIVEMKVLWLQDYSTQYTY